MPDGRDSYRITVEQYVGTVRYSKSGEPMLRVAFGMIADHYGTVGQGDEATYNIGTGEEGAIRVHISTQ